MKIVPYILLVAIMLSSCSFLVCDRLRLVDAKMATAVDNNFMPINVTDAFPKGTSKVSCWIKWRDAKINSQMLVSWRYVTDDIHILDYPFNLPKVEGMGGITLTMPTGKDLPPGSYRVDIYCVKHKHHLKSLKFTVG